MLNCVKALLKAAADAARLNVEWCPNNQRWEIFDNEGKYLRPFNPHEDDGEAFRLAISVGLCVLIVNGHICVTRYYHKEQGLNGSCKYLGDDMVNVRLAIIEAAAETLKQKW